MDLYNVFIFKSEWTYVTDCADFSSVLHGLQMAEYSPFVIARKNFLFSNTKNGAKASTIYFSLIESAKMNKLNPYKYLEYVLDTLSTKGLSNEIINSVLPYSKQLPKNLYVK